MSGRSVRAIIVLLLVRGPEISAQLSQTDDHIANDFVQPQVLAGYSAASERYFQDISGTFNSNTAFLAATIPVYSALAIGDEPLTSFFLLVRGKVSSLNPNISFLPSAHSMYISTVGMTGGIGTPGHHLYLLTVNAGFAEDSKTIRNPRFRPTGSLLGKYQLDKSFGFIYGLSYSYTFNRGLLLPILGAHCTLAKDLHLHLAFPFSMEIDFREIPVLHFGFVVRADGNQIHVDEADYFGPQSSPLYMRLSQIQGGFNVSFELSRNVWLCGEAGVLRNRKLAIGPLDDDLIITKIENSGYSSLILRYALGEMISWQR